MFGQDHGLIHEAVVTSRKILRGRDQEFWSALAHSNIIEMIVPLVLHLKVIDDYKIDLSPGVRDMTESLLQWFEFTRGKSNDFCLCDSAITEEMFEKLNATDEKTAWENQNIEITKRIRSMGLHPAEIAVIHIEDEEHSMKFDPQKDVLFNSGACVDMSALVEIIEFVINQRQIIEFYEEK